jgi:hypothetical protein
MIHVRFVIAGACVALALGVGCESANDEPIIEQPFAGATGGTAGVGGSGGLGDVGLGGMTGGTAGVGASGGLGGTTGGAAGVSVGGIGGAGGVGSMTDAMAGVGGVGGAGGVGGVGGAGGMVEQTIGIPCEVDTVVMNACHRCHGTDLHFGAPMALVTLDDFQRDYVAVSTKPLQGWPFKMYELARIRINREMGTSLMPQGPPLSDEDKATLNTWLVNGAPEGAACASR